MECSSKRRVSETVPDSGRFGLCEKTMRGLSCVRQRKEVTWPVNSSHTTTPYDHTSDPVENVLVRITSGACENVRKETRDRKTEIERNRDRRDRERERDRDGEREKERKKERERERERGR